MQTKHSIQEYLEYIGAQVPNGKSGWRKMKCPFHDDSHASAAVDFDNNIFKCHGCGVAGDVYKLIQHKEGVSYHEAIKYAETLSLTGYSAVQQPFGTGRRLSSNSQSVGRRGQNLSSGSGRRSSSGA